MFPVPCSCVARWEQKDRPKGARVLIYVDDLENRGQDSKPSDRSPSLRHWAFITSIWVVGNVGNLVVIYGMNLLARRTTPQTARSF
jgi:hypothetical protein